jgi:putative ABC transport system permease protein
MTVAVRSVAADPLALVPSVERAVWSIDAEMPLADLKTMDRVVSDSVARRRFSVLLLSVFAGVALLLAAIGLYGVIAYAVSQRTREFAIRMALGARSGQVVYMILREALLVTLVGVAVGVVAALGLTRLISGLLFGVAPTDPWTFGWIALLLALVALLAAAAPARRATRVDPLVALRCE